MARGGSGGGSKGGAQTVPYSAGNIRNNRYPVGYGFGGAGSPQPAIPTSIVAGGPNPYGAGNDLGASASRIIGDMRYNHDVGGYQGLPQAQPQPYRPQFQPFQPQRFPQQPYRSSPFMNYRSQPMPFRAPSPGKGGSKGGGMSVPRYPVGPGGADPNLFRNEVQPYRMPMQENPLGDRGMMRTMEMRPGRDYIPFMPPARQMQQPSTPPRPAISLIPQQATLQGLGGYFR